MRPRPWFLPCLSVVCAFAPALGEGQDVPFLESPDWIVTAMLELAEVSPGDVVYDLGSGDGRIVIAAAVAHDARGVGIEIDPELVALAEEAARAAGVAEKVRFVRADLFESDLREATVVMVYLYPKVNRRLAPILERQLAPGTRVVSHRYPIGDWRPKKRVKLGGRDIFLYVAGESER